MSVSNISRKYKVEKSSKNDIFSPYKTKIYSLLKKTVDHNRKGFSSEMGISLSTLNAGLAHKPPKFSLFHLPALLMVTKDFRILDWLCKICGFQAVKLPKEITPVAYIHAVNDALIALSWAQKHAAEALYLKGAKHEEELALRLDWAIAGAVRLREILRERKNAQK